MVVYFYGLGVPIGSSASPQVLRSKMAQKMSQMFPDSWVILVMLCLKGCYMVGIPELWKRENLSLGSLLLSPAKKEISVEPAEVFTAGPGPLNERLPC